jgi:hypothetical protein
MIILLDGIHIESQLSEPIYSINNKITKHLALTFICSALGSLC